MYCIWEPITLYLILKCYDKELYNKGRSSYEGKIHVSVSALITCTADHMIIMLRILNNSQE